MKIIAYYLPQYHEISENNKWWGEGFTEWTNVKNATPFFEEHYQPRIPLNKYYYNLLDDNVKKWQVEMAHEYGIYGFCFYHYWFDGKLLLERPVEQFLKNKSLDINFCICWANEPWTKAWVSKSDSILIDQNYGGKEQWKDHFQYLYPYFTDDRYIKDNGKPLMIIYKPEQIIGLNEMLDYWNDLALEKGLDGLCYAYQAIGLDLMNGDSSRFTYDIEYEPGYSYGRLSDAKAFYKQLFSFMKSIDKITLRLFNESLSDLYMKKIRKISYDDVWKECVNYIPDDRKRIAGAFVDWDNTPRRKKKGTIYIGGSPEVFKKYFKQKVESVKKHYYNDYLFIFAWNEWSEGGYLEPDEKYQFGYLEAIKEVMNELGEK